MLAVHCHNCGRPSPLGTKFCPHCGAELGKVDPVDEVINIERDIMHWRAREYLGIAFLVFGTAIIFIFGVFSFWLFLNGPRLLVNVPIDLFIPPITNTGPYVIANLRILPQAIGAVSNWLSILIFVLGLLIGLPYIGVSRMLFYFSTSQFDIQNIYRLLRRLAIEITNQK